MSSFIERHRSTLVIWLLAVGGAVAVIPYTNALSPGSLSAASQESGLSVNALLVISMVQSAVVLGLMSFAGLWAARKLGLGIPLIDAWLSRKAPNTPVLPQVRDAIAFGVIGASLIVALDQFVFASALEGISTEQTTIPVWKGFLASFYGGITEEVQMRLFLLSLLALGLRALLRRGGAGLDVALPGGVFWTANIVVAIVFGLGHLPAMAQLTEVTPELVARSVMLNGVIGIIAGYLFYRRGLEMAIVCHFSADIVLHVLMPSLA